MSTSRGGWRRLRRLWPVMAALLLGTGTAGAYEQRSGTFSLGLQGGIGLLSGRGHLVRGLTRIPYEDFDLGPGLGIRVRYSLDRSHAVGFSFEDLRFDRKEDAPFVPTFPADRPPRQLQVNNFLADYYLYFNRRQKVGEYLVLGVGFHRPSVRLTRSEAILPGEGWSANFGMGLEYFLLRPLSLDSSLRGYYLGFNGDGSALAAELKLGFQYYLLN